MQGASAAARLGHGYVGVEHVLLELLEGKPDADAQVALLAVGIEQIDVERHLEPPGEGERWISPTPGCTRLFGRAEGLALAAGRRAARSTDLLISLLWNDGQIAALDLPGGATREDVAAALAATGVTLPAAPMPSPPTWSEAWTRVTFPAHELEAVLAAMHRHHPDGQHWGWNVDGDGHAWVDAEQGLDLQPIIHELGLQADVEQHGIAERNRIRTLSVSAHDLGEILRERGDPGCVEHYQEAMDLAAGIGDNIGESIAAFNLGTVYKDIPALRDLDQAEHWYQHCLDLVGDKAPIRRARSLNQLGTVALNRLNDAITAHQPVEINRHLTDAGRRYQEALRLFPPDDIADLAVTHSQLGTVYRHAGDIPRAFEHYQRSIKYEIAMGDRFSAGATRFNIALLFATHRAADALLYAQAALADYESYGGGAQQQAEQARALIAALEQT